MVEAFAVVELVRATPRPAVTAENGLILSMVLFSRRLSRTFLALISTLGAGRSGRSLHGFSTRVWRGRQG